MTFLWHDYETFGTHPAFDRPAQFAAIRTDEKLEPLGEPMTWFSQPADDFLPHPMACLVTGITPQRASQEGLPETEFADHIYDQMMQPGTCGAGYNSLRFDDAVTRHLFYRNFLDPYEREYRNGNSRWDLIDLVRMTYALRPEGMNWPDRSTEAGVPSFRLEDLTAANDIDHAGAHDALVDVRATIALARQLRSAQPRLFDWGLKMRRREEVEDLLNPADPQPVVVTASRIPAQRGCTTLALPLATVPDRPKEIILFDLMGDPAALLELDAIAIAQRVFTRSDELPEGTDRIPLFTVGTNKVPMVAPAAVLRGVDQERIGLNSLLCESHATRLLEHAGELKRKLMDVYLRPPMETGDDPDGMLYSGSFFSGGDKAGFRAIKRTRPENLGGFAWDFEDNRVSEMLFRYRARNWPETLGEAEKTRWQQERLERLNDGSIKERLCVDEFSAELSNARAERTGSASDQAILDDVEAWAKKILAR